MRVDDRYSNSEETRANDKKNISKREQTQNASLNRQSSLSSSRQEQKSAFDQMMSNMLQEQNPNAQKMATDRPVKEVASDRERPKESKKESKDKDDDQKTNKSKEGPDTKQVHSSGSHARIEKKGGEGGEGGQKGSSGQHSSQSEEISALGEQHKSLSPASSGMTASSFEQKLDMAANCMQSPGQIPKQVLDQLVQYIRVSVGKKLDKEMHLDLSEKVFKGLSLKVVSRDGKVEVYFLTRHPDTRRLFEASKADILSQLAEKGVNVSSLEVKHVGTYSN